MVVEKELPNSHLHAIHATVSFILSVAGLVVLYNLDLSGYGVAAYPTVFAGSLALIIFVIVVLFAVHEYYGLRT